MDLNAWAEERGYRAVWGPWEAYGLAAKDLAERRRAGELDERLDLDYLAMVEGFDPHPEAAGRWVVVVLVPRPAHAVTFLMGGGPLRVLIPPTYVRYSALTKEVLGELQRSFFPGGADLEPLPGLLKATAARLGLVAYGRNNVAYAEGLGSYFQIVGCSTAHDLSEGAAVPGPPSLLDACEACGACASACPTGAIPEGRFLLRAERCTVYFNERVEEFPPWVPPSAHNSLIGCMLCQEACPENAGRLRVEETGLVFSEEETRSVLNPPSPDSAGFLHTAAQKLSTLGLTEEPLPIWRNLGALLAARK